MIIAQLLAGLVAWGGEDERAPKALSSIAIGVRAAKNCGIMRRPLEQRGTPSGSRVPTQRVRIEGNSGNTVMTDGFFVDVPGIIGSICGQMRWESGKSESGLIIEGREVGDITLFEGLVCSASTTSP